MRGIACDECGGEAGPTTFVRQAILLATGWLSLILGLLLLAVGIRYLIVGLLSQGLWEFPMLVGSWLWIGGCLELLLGIWLLRRRGFIWCGHCGLVRRGARVPAKESDTARGCC